MSSLGLSDRYDELSRLGSGGMGTVYKTRDNVLDIDIVIKVLKSESLDQYPDLVLRFQKEAKAAGGLAHDNLARVLDFGITTSGSPYMVMEYAEKPTLKQLINESGPLEITGAIDCFIQTANAMSYAHNNGIIHRDLKPENIILKKAENNEVKIKIVDFGIARLIDEDVESKLTQTGAIIGSPYYMSPEQAQGMPVDNRGDIYSLGCVIFECLTGHVPFKGKSALETIKMHIDTKAPSLKEFL